MSAKLVLPIIESVELHSISLYHKKPSQTLSFKNGVTCFAGANGIGKSTLLSLINFGLTGAVPTTTRKLKSTADYLKAAEKYSGEFFTGRITELDRDISAVTINFSIGTTHITIKRNVFSHDELEKFSSTYKGFKIKGKITPESQSAQYQEHITSLSGLKTFDQFVFLQHFLFTFDESRHLLFWDKRAVELIMHMAFGGDSTAAGKAEKIRRDMEKAESRIRNTKFQEKNVSDRISALTDVLQSGNSVPDILELQGTYEHLIQQRDEFSAVVDQFDERLSDIKVRVMSRSADLLALKNEYASTYTDHLRSHFDLAAHPLIHTSLNDHKCSICSSTSEKAIATITKKAAKTVCPLCDSDLKQVKRTKSSIQDLEKIDQKIDALNKESESDIKAQQRLTKELEAAQQTLQTVVKKIEKFEKSNPAATELLKNGNALASGQLDNEVKKLIEERATLTAQRQGHIKQRDSMKAALKVILESLTQRYLEAEQEFVPKFSELAMLFIGMEISINLETKKDDIGLVMHLQGSRRLEAYQLSESQRFFLDIALRMALGGFLVKNTPITLLIDTPEGSLDIAYEKRAGEMFAKFVHEHNRIIMTANINTSQMLIQLAAQSGKSHMKLVDMTKWSELTDVQSEESALFERAFDTVNKRLK